MIVRYHMIGFVDDSTCIVGGNKNDTVETLKAKMKEDAQLWHDLLWISGGKLELPKCGYHLIHYEFEPSGIPTMRYIEEDSIILKNEKNEDVKINSKNIFTPRRNLGHLKAPDGNQKTQVEAIRNNAVKLSHDIVRCKCTRSEAKMVYSSVWRKSVEYPLSQSFIPPKELDDIEKKSLPRIYSKCGYNRNTKREILKGPEELGGGGFIPLEASAGSGYVLHWLKYWRSPLKEEVSKMIRIVYAWNVTSAGVSFPLLEHPEIELSYLKGKVIPAI